MEGALFHHRTKFFIVKRNLERDEEGHQTDTVIKRQLFFQE